MNKTKLMLVACCVFLLGLGIASYANAVTIDTYAQAYLAANHTTETDADISPTAASAYAYNEAGVYGGSGGEEDYLFIATEAGASGQANGVIQGFAEYTAWGPDSSSGVDLDGWATSNITWEETYTPSNPGNYSWDFHILDGKLGFNAEGSPADIHASYKIVIRVDGEDEFNSAAEAHVYYDNTNSSWAYDYTPGGDALAYTQDSNDPTEWDSWLAMNINYDDYDGSVDLGYIDFGESRTISYLMTLSASDAGEMGYFNRDAWAQFGDPQNISAGSLTYNGSGTAPVPEPSTLLLMGIGLLGLVGYSRKRSKKS